jgi:2-polyprenyl-3-methyl-5-hydroxy-6-metoxy-1,4-benzoquinol methylase
MEYEPIKHSIDKVISRIPLIKKLFFRIIDIHLLRTWHIHRLIRSEVSRFKGKFTVLDAGCGFGQYSYFFLRKYPGCNVKGVDISEDHIVRAGDFFKSCGYTNCDFSTADLTKFSNKEAFQVVISVDVMEHILEDEMVFRNFHESMAKGGVLIINTPSDKGGSDAHEEHHGSFIDEHVRNGYSPAEITEKLTKAGFTNIETKYTYGTPGRISWILSMKYPITLLNISKVFFILLPFYFLITYPFCLILNYLDTIQSHAEGTGLLVRAEKI